MTSFSKDRWRLILRLNREAWIALYLAASERADTEVRNLEAV
jgi:hypothetical protein